MIGGELAVQLDASGAVLAVSGEISPNLSLDITPSIAEGDAAVAGIAASADANGVAASTLAATAPSLEILDIRLLGGPGLRVPRLVWRTTVSTADGIAVSDFVAVDAQTGAIALRFGQIASALERRICDRANVRNEAPCAAPYVRVEGDRPPGSPTPTLPTPSWVTRTASTSPTWIATAWTAPACRSWRPSGGVRHHRRGSAPARQLVLGPQHRSAAVRRRLAVDDSWATR